MLLLQLKNCHLIFRFYPLPFPVASQSSARAVSTHALSERMKEMSERIEAMNQITQNMDREFKSSRVVSTRLIYNGNWTEWSAIWSEIIRVISKSNECAARVWFEITSMISDQIASTQFNYHFLTSILKSQNLVSTSILLIE